jgi:hypothetical protein
MRQIAFALSLVLLVSCDKSTKPKPSIAGTWSGSGGGISMTVALTQTATVVSGNGSMSGSGGALALTAQGTFSEPNFSLTMSATGYQPYNFAGTLNGNSMTGVMNGSGFNQVGMTLTRQ